MKATNIPDEFYHCKDDRVRLSIIPGDDEMLKSMLATLHRGDSVVGQFRMDWEHWPFKGELLADTFGQVLDRFAAIGRALRKSNTRHKPLMDNHSDHDEC